MLVSSLEDRAPVNIALQLAKNITLLGHKTDVMYIDNKFGAAIPSEVSVLKFHSKMLLDKFDYDIVHSHGIRPDMLSVFFRCAFKVSTIHTNIWDDLSDSYNRFISRTSTFIWLKALLLKNNNICLSEAHRSIYEKELPNVEVIPNGIASTTLGATDKLIYKKIEDFSISGKVLFSVGAFRKIKGLEQIVSLLKLNDNFKCVFFGSGPESEVIKKLAIEYSVLERCLFLGFVREPHNYLRFCDCLLLTSYTEGFPLSLLEGIRGKVPLVCSDIDAYRGMKFDKLYKYELNNITMLNDVIEEAMSDPVLVDRLYKSFLENYSIENISGMYLKLYSNLVKKDV